MMQHVAGDKSRVRCPGCERVFEFDEGNRGFATRCPKCDVEFIIPEEGMDGVPLTEQPDGETFDITCPHCNTLFVLAREYRGEVADCAECHGLFLIPETGKLGMPVEDDATAEEPVNNDDVAPMDSNETNALRRTATVFLSREEVLQNAAEHGHVESGGDAPASSAEEEDDSLQYVDGPPLRGAFELNSEPVFEPAQALGGVRGSDLPEWLPPVKFEKREKIVEFEEGADPPLLPSRLTTFLPVLFIPLAAWLGSIIHPAMAGAFCFLGGLICWGIFVAKLLPRLYRKVIILTNYRVMMADLHEVVDIDLL